MVDHLQRMERQLEQAQATVASLRRLLEAKRSRTRVEYRVVPATPAIAIHNQISMGETTRWWFTGSSL
jgi:hypothetical protein